MQKARPLLTLGFAGLVFVVVAYLVLKLAPDWFAETKGLDANGQADARQGVRTAALALLAGLVAVVGAVYTARSFTLNRAGQLTDRFTKAIEQLGRRDELDVRLGGIYALERIARDSVEDHPQVVEVLTAYVREHAPKALPPRDHRAREAQQSTDEPHGRLGPDTDVQAVLTVLGRRTLAHEKDTMPRPDLSSTDLSHASFRRANLGRASLSGANLRAANFNGAVLSGTALSKANLSWANLRQADLRGRSSTRRTSPGRSSALRSSSARISGERTSSKRASTKRS
jgi:hypothetical protein